MFRARKDIICFFGKGIFPFKANVYKTKEEESKEESKEERFKKYINNTFTFIEEKSENINNDFFKTYFNFSAPTDLTKKLFKTKDKKKNSELVKLIRVRWSNLKDEIEKMSKPEIKNEKPNEILGIVNEIIDFNKEIQKQQERSGLKILMPNQMLSELQISLAQLKAGNNSEKLKNEIRQILYSLYRPEKLTKQLYKSVINII